jgi:ppGpp synthetase/RelA/SpoT-type nucleotidyltranferase
MADSKNPEDSKRALEAVLSEFDSKEDMLAALCVKTKSLIEASLEDANIPYQSVQVRVKSKKKLAEKYTDPKKDYRRLEDITDLAGIRIITYYEDHVDRAAKVIEREFVVDRENSVDKRDAEPDRFGYNALNYVCTHLPKRVSDVEYKKFAGVRCEIQITSILRHAWSEMEHEWYDLKDAYPAKVKRRFYRIAALLELAESEFLDIRNRRKEYERSVAVRVEANVLDLPIDVVSLKSFIEQEPIVASIDGSLARVMGRRLEAKVGDAWIERRASGLKFIGLTKLQELRDSLEQFKNAIPEYVDRCRREKVWQMTGVGILPKGISIYHLSGMLVSLRGKEAIVKFWTELGPAPHWNTELQAAIAKEVAAKHSLS